MDRGEKNTLEPYVKRVTLPSGKSIEVLYFADRTVEAPSAPATAIAAHAVDFVMPPDQIKTDALCDLLARLKSAAIRQPVYLAAGMLYRGDDNRTAYWCPVCQRGGDEPAS